MRVISGKYKGQLLKEFSADHIRPTTDRVKESLFNILQSHLVDANVLDLFAGTGNLGIEALSRGAAHVFFVENHPKSLEIIRTNILKLKITEPHQIINSDVMKYLKLSTLKPMDVIFADPPFTQEMSHDILTTISKSPLFGPNTIMAIESKRREKLEDQYGPVYRADQRNFGDKILSFFKLKNELESETIILK